MGLVEELERLALKATKSCKLESTPTDDEIQRWGKLFSYSPKKAIELIELHRHDYACIHVSDDHWEYVRETMEHRGHSKNSYEHQLMIKTSKTTKKTKASPKKSQSLSLKKSNTMYLVRLEEPLNSVDIVKNVAKLKDPPEIMNGQGLNCDVVFCIVNCLAITAISEWLTVHAPDYVPTFVYMPSRAEKSLSKDSHYPTLCMDSTVPQYRLNSDSQIPNPPQDQYPVW
jgi:hypothetical protein